MISHINSNNKSKRIFTWSAGGFAAVTAALLVLLLVVPPDSTFSKGKSCVDCHKEIKEQISQKKVHDPAGESCETCHKRHGFKQELILVKGLPELCIDCHADIQDEISGEHVHGALSQGGCTICHDPHASDNNAFLRELETAQSVCTLCHTDLTDAMNADDSHEPFRKGACAECHAAHSSEHNQLLLDSESAVCDRCHEGTIEKHSIPGVDNYECSDCHDPHMASGKNPLASTAHEVFAAGECESCHTLQDGEIVIADDFPPADLCATCHSDEADHLAGGESHFAENTLKTQGTTACLECHDPHSSRIAGLGIAEQNDLCRRCHEELPASDAFKGIMHSPFEKGTCSTCHDPHGGGGEMHLSGTPNELCSSCHADIMSPLQEGEIRHGALESVECIECHAAHGSKISPLLKQEPHTTCFECHDKEDHEAEHSPYVTDVCFACHKNHSSRENLLVGELDAVCAKCHSDIAMLADNASVPHPPVKEESCDFCHLPHGSDNPGLLDVPQNELCASCHDLDALLVTLAEEGGTAAQARNGADAAKTEPQHTLHAPFSQNSCARCHNPHGSNQDKLLNRGGADLCYGCHTREKSDFEKGSVHAPVQEGSCSACHTPHGSSGEALALKAQPELCTQCHDFSTEPQKSAHKGFDVTKTICTTCHNPHNGADEHLLKGNTHQPFAEGSCDACHEETTGEPAGAMSPVDPGVCMNCHDDLAEGHGHQQIEGLQCANCHNPHASKFQKLLDNPKTLCLNCHGDIMQPDNNTNETLHIHKPIETGSCLDCHQMHEPSGRPLLVENQKELCANCHDSIKERADDLTQHAPFRDGKCEQCHATHYSTEAHLLKVDKTALCKSCHDFGTAKMKTAHNGYPLSGTGCSTCHDPHSTADANSKLMLSVRHAPYGDGDCSVCHDEAGVPGNSSALCLECHDDGDTFAAVHSGGRSKSEATQAIVCLDCHSPHAGYETMFKRPGQKETCVQCHDRAEFSKTHVHGALESGCTSCHDVHNSNMNNFSGESLNNLCIGCHEEAMQHAHPLGIEYKDPRTDEPLTCLSCHEPHSSEHDKILTFDQQRDLCIQCHSTGH